VSYLILLCKGLNSFIRPREVTYLGRCLNLEIGRNPIPNIAGLLYSFLLGKVDDIELPVCRTAKVR